MARYVVSDLHGRFDLYQEIERFRKSGDKIFCLGDCGDRGLKSFETIKSVANNPDWTYMMGNHEHMTLEALREETGYGLSNFYTGALETSFYNGGEDAFNGMMDEPEKWIKYLSNLEWKLSFENNMGYDIILTHSGYDITNDKPCMRDCIWDRSHFNLPWPTGRKYEKIVMIHGHTPIPTMVKDWKPEDGSLSYADGHKINIDAGSIWTGVSILFDLDTFDEHIFDCGEA